MSACIRHRFAQYAVALGVAASWGPSTSFADAAEPVQLKAPVLVRPVVPANAQAAPDQLQPRPHIAIQMIVAPTDRAPNCEAPTTLQQWSDATTMYAGCKLPDGRNDGITYQLDGSGVLKLTNYENGQKEGLEFDFRLPNYGITEFHGGVRDGVAYTFETGGELVSAVTWKGDVRSGVAIENLRSAPRVSTYVAGVRQGPVYTWAADGAFEIGNVVDDELDGVQRTMLPTGELQKLETFKHNKREGAAYYFDSKGLSSAGNFVAGVKDGPWYERATVSENQVAVEIETLTNYQNDVPDGLQREWRDDGLVLEVLMQKGIATGPYRFWRLGQTWTSATKSQFNITGAFWQGDQLLEIEANGNRRNLTNLNRSWFPITGSARIEVFAGSGATGIGGALSIATPITRAHIRRVGGKVPYESVSRLRWEAGLELADDETGAPDSKDARMLIGPLLRVARVDAPNDGSGLGVVDSMVYVKLAPFLGREKIAGTTRSMQGVRIGAGLTQPSIHKAFNEMLDDAGSPVVSVLTLFLFLIPNTIELNAEYAHTSEGSAWRYGVSVGYGL